MARKKTRKEKVKAASRRVSRPETGLGQGVYEFDRRVLAKTSKSDSIISKGESKAVDVSLFEYDPRLLAVDIRKTLVVSLIVLGMLMGVYQYLN